MMWLLFAGCQLASALALTVAAGARPDGSRARTLEHLAVTCCLTCLLTLAAWATNNVLT